MIIARLPAGIVRAPHQGKPNFRRARREHLRRHHANDRVGLVAEIHGASEHVWVARKKSLPQTVANNGDERSAHAILLFGKDATQLRREPNHFEKVRRDQASTDLLGRAPFETAQVE